MTELWLLVRRAISAHRSPLLPWHAVPLTMLCAVHQWTMTSGVMLYFDNSDRYLKTTDCRIRPLGKRIALKQYNNNYFTRHNWKTIKTKIIIIIIPAIDERIFLKIIIKCLFSVRKQKTHTRNNCKPTMRHISFSAKLSTLVANKTNKSIMTICFAIVVVVVLHASQNWS